MKRKINQFILSLLKNRCWINLEIIIIIIIIIME